jgi:ABC-type microcin C transport system permease subunit YejE
MDESSQLIVLLLLFIGLFLNWSTAVISAAIAIVIRNRGVSLAVALIVGALEGLLGSRLELLDVYLTRDGWVAIDALTLITVVLSAAASLLWWLIARTLLALVLRIVRGPRAAN